MSSKRLVAYFSCSGVTKQVAENLAEAASADLYEIRPEVPYTKADLDWMDKKSRSTIEMNDPASRPAIAGSLPATEDFNTIFIGFPIWWYSAPTIINTFVENCNLKGKTLIPFATSGSTAIEGCEKKLQDTYPELTWKKGRLLNGNPSPAQLTAWIKEILA